MTLKGAIKQLMEMRENSMMPEMFKPYFDKVIETVSECEEPSAFMRGEPMSDLIDNGGYRFWDDDFSLQSAYEDCKSVFDGITDDNSFQECDTGLILFHAHEIMYALNRCLH